MFFIVAAEKLKAISESRTAWDPAYGSLMGEDDDTRVPECAERFMQLIAGITGTVGGLLGVTNVPVGRSRVLFDQILKVHHLVYERFPSMCHQAPYECVAVADRVPGTLWFLK